MSPRSTMARAVRERVRGAACLTAVVVAAVALSARPEGRPREEEIPWKFTDVTVGAGVSYEHGFLGDPDRQAARIAGGVAAGDYDGDGWVDLYCVRGDIGPNLLFRNLGNGTFLETGRAAGVALEGTLGSGPTFADFDGDGRLDLLIGGVEGSAVGLFRNRGDGTFQEVTGASGVRCANDTFSAAFGDYDRDGDLDLYLAHWLPVGPRAGYLWRNEGHGSFTDVSDAAGITGLVIYDFTPNFSDIDSDGWPDLLIAADFGTSRVLLNHRDGTFSDYTSGVISDENGMGGAVGDYDNDGDLDWFVSSIYDPDGVAEGNWGTTGNRLYRNGGDGTFEDATDEAGVRDGRWGWGTCFADFNNDGYLDLLHVNGWFDPRAQEFLGDPARLFISNGDGSFSEKAAELGVADTGAGRGVACFDYDRDGDIDIFIANNRGSSRLFRNDGGNRLHFLDVRLRGFPPNTEAIGSRIFLTAGGMTQMREVRAGSNFESQDPAEAHFGLGREEAAKQIRVVWPDGLVTLLRRRNADRRLEITHPCARPGLRLGLCLHRPPAERAPSARPPAG